MQQKDFFLDYYAYIGYDSAKIIFKDCNMLRILKTQEFFTESSLPLSVFECSHYANDERRHTHEFCELVIVKSGRALHTTDVSQYEIKSGDVFIIPKGSFHKYTEVNDLFLINVLYDPVSLPLPVMDMNDFVFFNIMFRKKKDFRKSDLDLLLSLNQTQLEEIIKLSTNISDQRNPYEPGTQFGSLAAFMRMIVLLSKWHYKEQDTHGHYYTVGKVLEYLNKHYLERVDMDKLARLSAMSRRTMFRHFVKAAGCTPGVYLCRLRIRHAADMLAQTSVPIKEIAQCCGFCDSNYFSKQFKKIMSTSPLRYRKQK
jgi:AraC-like DNA-binding protein